MLMDEKRRAGKDWAGRGGEKAHLLRGLDWVPRAPSLASDAGAVVHGHSGPRVQCKNSNPVPALSHRFLLTQNRASSLEQFFRYVNPASRRSNGVHVTKKPYEDARTVFL